MSLILGIDTSNDNSCVTIQRDYKLLFCIKNNIKKDHARFIHVALDDILKESGININHFDAISLVNGPGSYTGLRIGLSTAKGLCFAINKPLIALNTLDIMALGIKLYSTKDLIFSSIDSRENEVFGALYNFKYEPIIAPSPIILNEELEKNLNSGFVVNFVGTGSQKICKLYKHNFTSNIVIQTYDEFIDQFVIMSYQHLIKNKFENITDIEPFYLKPAFIKQHNADKLS